MSLTVAIYLRLPQFKGSGSVNSAMDPNGKPYRFMLRVANGSPDSFKIRIHWEDATGEHVVFDNDNSQVIGGGNIAVQVVDSWARNGKNCTVRKLSDDW